MSNVRPYLVSPSISVGDEELCSMLVVLLELGGSNFLLSWDKTGGLGLLQADV